MYSFKNIIILLYILLNLFYFSSELRNLRLEEIYEENTSQENQTYIKPPEFSNISGFYPENFRLKLFSEENTEIFYTDDSSNPINSTTRKKYKDSILIYDKSSEQNIYSSMVDSFQPPSYPVDKAMIIRAVTKNSKEEFSDIISKTYFITNENLYKYQDLTVISIVTNPDNFFDPNYGIYVKGNMNKEAQNRANYKMRGKEWEREVILTIFDKGEKIVEQKVGIRIKGTATRKMPGKSFNIFARKKYGKKNIKFNLLKDNFDIKGNLITSYKSLSLRNVYEESKLRDKVVSDLFYSRRKNLSFAKMIKSILFFNGEYWGLYLIQEKIDNDFISNNYLIPSENITYAKNNQFEDGIKEVVYDFQEFGRNYSKINLSDEKIYEEIEKKIDLNSLLELFATNLYILNLDWPGRNDGEWKNHAEIQEGNEYSDGRWRFIGYDFDITLGIEFPGIENPLEYNNFLHLLESNRLKQTPVNLFVGLLKNNTIFRNRFINIYCDYANDVYDMEKVNKLIEEYREEFTDLMAYSELRWSEEKFDSILEGYSFYKTKYLKTLNSLLNFFDQRPKITLQHMKEFLEIKGNLVDLNIEIRGKGKVQINTIIPIFNDNKWKGKYFSGIPINIKAIPDPDIHFNEWIGYEPSNKENIEIILFEPQTIICVFTSE
jgi:hypothetical protein